MSEKKQSEQNTLPKSSKNRRYRGNRNYKRNDRSNITTIQRLADKLHSTLTSLNDNQPPTYSEAREMQSRKDTAGLFDNIELAISKKGGMNKALTAFGRKILLQQEPYFKQMSRTEKLQVLAAALGDDFFTSLAPHLVKLAPIALEMLLPWLLHKLGVSNDNIELTHKYLGNFLNDDPQAGLSNHFTIIPQDQPQLITGSDQFSAVNLEAVKSVYYPECYGSIVPTDEPDPVGYTKKMVTYKVTTNANGDVICNIRPEMIFGYQSNTQAFFIVQNDVTLNTASGTQTPAPTYTPGPLYSSVNNIVTYQVQQFAVSAYVTSSALNAQGTITMWMCHENTTVTWNTAPIGVGTDLANSFPYVNVSGIHTDLARRMVIPTQHYDDDFSPAQQASTSGQGIGIIVTGAQPNAAVLTVTVTYGVCMMPAVGIINLIDLRLPGPGIQTVKLLAQLASRYKELAMLGLKEAAQLCNIIESSQPDFDSVIRVIKTFVKGIGISDGSNSQNPSVNIGSHSQMSGISNAVNRIIADAQNATASN